MVRVYAPSELRGKIRSFAQSNQLSLDVVEEKPWDIQVVLSTGPERTESSADVLQAGGMILCATAWAMSAKHSSPLLHLGALFNELDIRIRQCSLGCFK